MFPVLFQYGDFVLPTYGAFYLLAMLSGIAVASHLTSQTTGIRFWRYFDLGFMIVIAGEVGARLAFVVVEWPRFRAGTITPMEFLVAGRVVLGGILAAVVFGAWLVWRHRLPVVVCVDAGLVGAALGMGIGRLGCLVAGCCYGKPTGLAWGITFSHPLAERLQGTPLGVPLHPTQIVQSLIGFLLFAFLYWVHRRKVFDGQVAIPFLLLAGVSRFLMEYLRGDPRGQALGLATSQWIGLTMILAGAVWFWVARKTRA